MKTKLLKLVTITMALFFVLVSSSAMVGLSSDVKKENRNVGDFDKISLSISADLYLTQGSKNEVIIEADEDVLEKIETEVNGGTLSIEFERWYNYRGTKNIKIYVTVKSINKLVLAGSGDIISKSPIKTEKLGLVITGSGTILIDDLNTKRVYAVISGSGDIRLGGKIKANKLDATVTGSGDIITTDMEFKEADLTITGSGVIKAFVTERLDADITGSGKIYYKGKPLIDANVTGSGRIRNDN